MVRLKADKGLQFPTTGIELPPLTAKDFRELDFVAADTDLVGFSFVPRIEDVELRQAHRAARRPGLPAQAIVLKIETPLAIRNLPRLALQSAADNPTGVITARGDLAVEIGFVRLSEIQEEIFGYARRRPLPSSRRRRRLTGSIATASPRDQK